MIYDLCAKQNWLSSFFFLFLQHTSFFFSFFFLNSQCPHMHSYREIPDSWPTCLGSLMPSSVVPDNFLIVLIYHQEALYQRCLFFPHGFRGGRKQAPLTSLLPLSLSPLRSVGSAGEGGAGGVVVSWPDGQPALRLHRCHGDPAHHGQTRTVMIRLFSAPADRI